MVMLCLLSRREVILVAHGPVARRRRRRSAMLSRISALLVLYGTLHHLRLHLVLRRRARMLLRRKGAVGRRIAFGIGIAILVHDRPQVHACRARRRPLGSSSRLRRARGRIRW